MISLFIKFKEMRFKYLFITCLISISARAQENNTQSPWTHSGLTGLNFSQTSFSQWSEGGENSISGNAYFNGSLNYTKGKSSWTNDLSANYGLYYTDNNGWRKNIDNLNFASKYGRKISDKLFYAALLDFKTQLTDGFDYKNNTKSKVSRFMTPGYINLSLGIDYKPNENISVYYSPLSGKVTLINDTTFSVRYGVDAGEKIRNEFGSNFKGTVNYNFYDKKMTVKSTLDLFTAYNESFGNVDVNWDVLVGLNFTKLLTLTFQSTLKYDDDIASTSDDGTVHGAKVQFKEIIGVGISYKF
jgi:hypothetical protein